MTKMKIWQKVLVFVVPIFLVAGIVISNGSNHKTVQAKTDILTIPIGQVFSTEEKGLMVNKPPSVSEDEFWPTGSELYGDIIWKEGLVSIMVAEVWNGKLQLLLQCNMLGENFDGAKTIVILCQNPKSLPKTDGIVRYAATEFSQNGKTRWVRLGQYDMFRK